MRPALLLFPLLALAACMQAPAPQAETAAGLPAAKGDDAPTVEPTPPVPAIAGDTSVASPTQFESAESSGLARTDGYGGLPLGMSEAEARAAWQGELKGDVVDPGNCAYLHPKAYAEFRVGFMFERGTFVRYDVNIESEAAPSGGRVGQSRADIERLYAGRVQVQPHKYVQGGHYLRVADTAIENGALVFEADENGRVTRWRVGRAPQVDYVEGCA